MITPALSIGPHAFAIFPLNLQKIEERTKAKWPAISRFGTHAARQATGLGEDDFNVEGLFFHEEWGGFEEYLALKATQRALMPVPLLGWGAASGYASVFGMVVLLEVGATHEHIGEGIGRVTKFDIKLGAKGGLF